MAARRQQEAQKAVLRRGRDGRTRWIARREGLRISGSGEAIARARSNTHPADVIRARGTVEVARELGWTERRGSCGLTVRRPTPL
jgi:hypothetical protein